LENNKGFFRPFREKASAKTFNKRFLTDSEVLSTTFYLVHSTVHLKNCSFFKCKSVAFEIANFIEKPPDLSDGFCFHLLLFGVVFVLFLDHFLPVFTPFLTTFSVKNNPLYTTFYPRFFFIFLAEYCRKYPTFPPLKPHFFIKIQPKITNLGSENIKQI